MRAVHLVRASTGPRPRLPPCVVDKQRWQLLSIEMRACNCIAVEMHPGRVGLARDNTAAADHDGDSAVVPLYLATPDSALPIPSQPLAHNCMLSTPGPLVAPGSGHVHKNAKTAPVSFLYGATCQVEKVVL